jgi:RHS repeat-associated protein
LAVYIWGDTLFNHANHLGSTTLRTNQAGTAIEDILFYPWGYVWQLWGSGGFNFAELPYADVTTTTHLTAFRVFSPNLGRWHSPDPMWPVAVRLDDPQTWNMYAYVRNNPTGLVDPSGAEYCKVVTDSEGNQSIDTTSCVSDTEYGNNSEQYPDYVQVSQDVTVYVTASLSSADPYDVSVATVPSILLTPYALLWLVQQPPPPATSTIQAQPNPPPATCESGLARGCDLRRLRDEP